MDGATADRDGRGTIQGTGRQRPSDLKGLGRLGRAGRDEARGEGLPEQGEKEEEEREMEETCRRWERRRTAAGDEHPPASTLFSRAASPAACVLCFRGRNGEG